MLFIAVPCISNAQTSRAGNWEGSISAIYQESSEFDGENGSFVDIESDWGFGFNFALNINPKLSVGMDIEYLKPKYSMLLSTIQVLTMIFGSPTSLLSGTRVSKVPGI